MMTKTFSTANNRVTTSGFTYDNSGNITDTGPSPTLTYNLENFMTAAGSSTYGYDAEGRRVKKTVSGVTTDYFYAGSVVIAEKQGSSWTDYILFGNQRIAKQTGATVATATFIHPDHLGSTRVCTASNGSATGQCNYDPFGELQAGTSCPATVTYRYAGMEWDSETGLYHTWFRQYDTKQGRWLSVDPLPGSAGSPQSLNRYTYVLNDPVNLVDPSGLDSCRLQCHITIYSLVDEEGTILASWIVVNSCFIYGCTGAGGLWEFVGGNLGELWERLLDWIAPIQPLPPPASPPPVPPVNPCYITNAFDPPSHPAIDITTARRRGFPGHGTVVLSPVTGKVSNVFRSGTPGGRANSVSITSSELVWGISHVTAPAGFFPGLPVYAGMPVGVTDPTGVQDAAHVDLRVRLQGQWERLNPAPLLPDCSPATPQSRR